MKKPSRVKELLRGLATVEFLLYALVGCLTTAVSVGSYHVCESLLGFHYSLANVISWILSVTFAYVANKILVFHSKTDGRSSLLREAALFYGGRLVSLGIEEGGLVLFIDLLHMNPLAAKIILQVVVVAINYVFSKLVIFKKKDSDAQ